MKRRIIFLTGVVLTTMIFIIMGCGSSGITYIDSNDSDGSDDEIGDVPAQFENGIALFGHDVETGAHFIRHLTPKMGDELSRAYYDHHDIESMTPIWIDGKQYVMGTSCYSSGTFTDKRFWFIQRIYPTGDFGPITDHGYFDHYYKTLMALPMTDGRVFIFGQMDYSGNRAFTIEVLPGGKLADKTAWHDDSWDHYYDTSTPIPHMDDRTCFFIHNSHDDNTWHIKCLEKGTGAVYNRNSGSWDTGYQVALAYRRNDMSHLFQHRHHYDWESTHTFGPWFIKDVNFGSYVGDTTDHGTWDNYYQTMTIFKYTGGSADYIIGHNTDKYWFIQYVNSLGHMKEEIQHGGPWDKYYEHLFPIDFNVDYLHSHNWMGNMFDTIEDFGNRKLSQIALPGSHDTGMNEDDIGSCDMGGRSCNTATQREDIEGQLNLGARYFDIRPKVEQDNSGLYWRTGHVSSIVDATAGCLGEDKFSIINSLQAFFEDDKHSKELVILKIAHCTNPPQTADAGAYARCTDSQRSEMAHNLAGHLGDLLVKGEVDLNNMTLNEILENGNIILVVQGVRDRDNGIYRWGHGSSDDYYIYDEYSITEDFDTMVNGGKNNNGDIVPGQIAKLRNPDNHTGNYNGFLLSWTLTLSTWDAVKCPLGDPPNILELADRAQPQIYDYMYRLGERGEITKTLFPNILYVDTFNKTTTNAAIYLNKKYDSLSD